MAAFESNKVIQRKFDYMYNYFEIVLFMPIEQLEVQNEQLAPIFKRTLN